MCYVWKCRVSDDSVDKGWEEDSIPGSIVLGENVVVTECRGADAESCLLVDGEKG